MESPVSETSLHQKERHPWLRPLFLPAVCAAGGSAFGGIRQNASCHHKSSQSRYVQASSRERRHGGGRVCQTRSWYGRQVVVVGVCPTEVPADWLERVNQTDDVRGLEPSWSNRAGSILLIKAISSPLAYGCRCQFHRARFSLSVPPRLVKFGPLPRPHFGIRHVRKICMVSPEHAGPKPRPARNPKRPTRGPQPQRRN